MNETLEQIYATRTVVGQSGTTHPLTSAVDREEGAFLHEIIRDDPDVRRTLEVGCAYGISSLFICSALQGRPGASHTMIDFCQSTKWDNVGVLNLQRAGYDFFELIEDRSELALPRLLEAGEGRYDFILVDGWHTFDHTLLDAFYATRLLRVGGYLAVDDTHYPSVRRVISFLKSYPCYEVHGVVDSVSPSRWMQSASSLPAPLRPVARATVGAVEATCRQVAHGGRIPRMVALRKTAEDQRNWDWHEDF